MANANSTSGRLAPKDQREQSIADPPASKAPPIEAQLLVGAEEIRKLTAGVVDLQHSMQRTGLQKPTFSSGASQLQQLQSEDDYAAKSEKFAGANSPNGAVAPICKTGASNRAHKYVFSIWYACRHGREERVNILLERGVDVDARDAHHQNATPLQWACKFGHTDIAKKLISRGASVNTIDNDGNSPLHLAAGAGGSLELVRLLLEEAAETRIKNREGHMPAKVARLADRVDFAELIERWKPCGGFSDLREAPFEFQRAEEGSLTFTLPPPEAPPPVPRPVKWVTPLEAKSREHQARIAQQLQTQQGLLNLKESRLGKDHPSIAVTLRRIAMLLRELGIRRRPDAIQHLQRSLDIQERSLASLESLRAKSLEAAASQASEEDKGSLNLMQGPHINQNKAPLGGRLLDAVRLGREQLADTLEELAELQSAQGEFLVAEGMLRRSLDAIACMPREASLLGFSGESKRSNRPHIRTASTQTNLGLVLRALGREDEARTCLREALQIIEERFGEHLHTAELLEHLAAGYDKDNIREDGNNNINGTIASKKTRGDLRAKAAILRERALEIISEKQPGTIAHVEAQESLAGTYYSLHKFEQSKALFESALRLREHLKQSMPEEDTSETRQSTRSKADNLGESERDVGFVTKVELRATSIGHTVDDVIGRLQQREYARLAKEGLSKADNLNSLRKSGEDSMETQETSEVEGDLLDALPGPQVLMQEDVLQGYRNLASAEIQHVRKSKREWKRKKKALARRRRKLEALRRADDRKYVRERAQRLMEGREDE